MRAAGCNGIQFLAFVSRLTCVKTKYRMKIFRILAVVAMMAVAVVGCNKDKNGQGGGGNSVDVSLEQVAKQWKLYSVGDVEAEFVVYLDLKSDMSFELYQQMYTLDYEGYIGTYSLDGNVLSGSYITGQNWKSDYRIVGLSDTELKLESIEENSITMVYRTATIPDDITTTRSRTEGAVPFM